MLTKNPFTLSIFIILFLLTNKSSQAQCSTILESTDGYYIEIIINSQTLVITGPSDCSTAGWYNYQLEIDYEVNLFGSNVPSSLWTLQGYLECDPATSYFNLPNGGGSGITYTSTAANYAYDCSYATPSSLNCSSIFFNVNGSGINTSFNLDCEALLLDVELSEFKAELISNTVDLFWTTESEVDNDYFVVERSTDGNKWNAIDTLSGQGNSSQTYHYKTNDINPLYGVSYYRLKQVDFNGQVTYFESQKIENYNQNITIFPNPSNQLIYINGIETTDQNNIQVYSINGKHVTDQTSISFNNRQVEIDFYGLTNGIYIININGISHKVSLIK